MINLSNSMRCLRKPEAKGFFFNRDKRRCSISLKALSPTGSGIAICAARAGWLPPIGTGQRHHLSVIYRAPDVEEYGSCYCGLYVCRHGMKDDRDGRLCPERRPLRGSLSDLGLPRKGPSKNNLLSF